MEFLILGPIDVRNAEGAVALGGIKPKAVLAVLLLHANEPVSAERLALALWGEDAPGGAVKTVQVHVSRLRKALGDPDVVATTPAGYRLRVLPGELDAEHFERLVEDARRALADGRPEDASAVLREALALWRGPALAELALEPFASAEIARLEEQRLAALELRVDADLAAGRHAEVVGELQRLVSEHPTRERLAGQHMLALYRCGRQSEALETYAAARRVLVDEMGVEPGPQLRDLHGAILRQDVALQAQPAEAELAPQLDAATEQPIAGRDDELAWLLEHWEKARAGEGAIVTVAGPRGAGKRRLLAEVASTIHRPGVAVLYASGDGPGDAVVAAVRRAGEAARPTLLVVDAADRAGRGALAELARVAPQLSAAPVLVVALAEDALALAHLRAGDALELGPLDEDAVRAIAARYAPGTAAAELPAEWLLKASEGVASRVHDAASQWARREAARHVDAVAGRAEAGRAELRSMEAELTGGVVALQETRDREPPRGGGGGGGEEGPPVVCPFKGLASYDVGDARHFFGRERLVAELVARLVGAPLLGVVGPSGSGKSSLLRAGLLPALAAGVLPGSEGWPQVLLRPGAHPLSELALGLAKVQGDGRIVLAVDQFEETFTVCEDDNERAEFVSELVKAAEDPDGRWVVVIALRADYYGRCAEYPELAAMLGAGNVLVRPMAPDELRRAIERPAQRVGLRIEPELVDALVADVEREPGGLPLMSTALLELWQRRDGRRLRHSAYAQTGGVQGAVARLAESAFAQLDEGQQTVARGVLMRLVGSTDGDAVERRRVALEELEIARDENVARVVALLTDRRLLTVSAGSVELAHEALLREWPRLRGWIEDDRDGLRIQRGLGSAAGEWERLGRDEGALFRGTRLGEAVEWRESSKPVLNKLEREFLAAGEGAREHDRVTRRRRTALLAAAAGAVVLAVVVVAVITLLTKRERDIVASRDMAAKSASVLVSNPGLALAVAREALERHDTGPARGALRAATQADREVATLRADKGKAFTLATSADGRIVVTGGDDGSAKVWDAERMRLTKTIKGLTTRARHISLSGDGRRLAIKESNASGVTVRVVDLEGRNLRPPRKFPADSMQGIDISPDGSMLALGMTSGDVRLLGVDKPGLDRVLGHHESLVYAVSFSPDGSRLVGAAGEGDGARVWDVAGAGQTAKLDLPNAELYAADWGPNGRIATADSNGNINIWDPDDTTNVRNIHVDDVSLLSARFSGDGRRVVTGGYNGEVRISDVRTGALLSDMRGHTTQAQDAAFVPHHSTVVSVGYDGTLRFWVPPAVMSSRHHGTGATFSRDGRYVVAGSEEGGVVLWDLKTTDEKTIHRGVDAPGIASFSADGDQVVSNSPDGQVRLLDVGGGSPRDVPAKGSGEDDAPYASAVDQGGNLVAIGWASGLIVVQAPDGSDRRAFAGHDDAVLKIALSPDGKHLASASEDNAAKIWNVDTGGLEHTLRGHAGPVQWVTYSDDGARIATSSSDATARIWSGDGRERAALLGHSGQVNTVQFNAQGDRVITAGDDGTVRVWDASSGDPLLVLRTYDTAALSADFGPHGQIVSEGKGGVMTVSPCEVCGSSAQVERVARTRAERALTPEERGQLLGEGG